MKIIDADVQNAFRLQLEKPLRFAIKYGIYGLSYGDIVL